MSQPQIVLAINLVPAFLLGAFQAMDLMLRSTKAPRSPWGGTGFKNSCRSARNVRRIRHGLAAAGTVRR